MGARGPLGQREGWTEAGSPGPILHGWTEGCYRPCPVCGMAPVGAAVTLSCMGLELAQVPATSGL